LSDDDGYNSIVEELEKVDKEGGVVAPLKWGSKKGYRKLKKLGRPKGPGWKKQRREAAKPARVVDEIKAINDALAGRSQGIVISFPGISIQLDDEKDLETAKALLVLWRPRK
jgi:hypothetical protein